MSAPVTIYGYGYTGRRVARRLAARGIAVVAATRRPGDADIRAVPLDAPLEPGTRVLYTIPPVDPDPLRMLLQRSSDQIARFVYVSTTGVYGPVLDVDEHTEPQPRFPSDSHRLGAEALIVSHVRSTVVLRAAAIYGPGRGVHVAMREDRFRLLGDGGNFVSRIHVDDLAAICDAALFSDVTGAWPVADDHPCTSREIVEFCAGLLGVGVPPPAAEGELHTTRRANRRVDGRAIRHVLGIALRYPSYQNGIPASMEDEKFEKRS